MSRILQLPTLTVALLLIAAGASAQPTVHLSGEFLTIDGIADTNGAVVKIVGPSGYRFRKEVGAGKPIDINLTHALDALTEDEDAAFLTPGLYSYEIISRPSGERAVGSFRIGDTTSAGDSAPRADRKLDPSSGELVSPATTASDYLAVQDTAGDGVTAVSLQAKNGPFAGIVNENGILSIRQHSGTISGDVGGTLMSAKASLSGSAGDAAVGIGSSVPTNSLDIVAGSPTINLESTDGGTNWKLTNSSGRLIIGNDAGNVLVIEDGALADALVIDATGVTLSSSRAVKKNIEPAASDELFEQLLELPIYSWSYADDDSGAIHVGPMAEDFFERLGFGRDERRISPLDTSGLALAGIQALRRELDKRDAEIAELKAAVARLLAEDSASAERQSGQDPPKQSAEGPQAQPREATDDFRPRRE
jgi:hypothetical protein